MASSLESLLAEGVISEIYGRLKSGKEADVYAVCYGDAVVAAKVYKDRAQRSFKSNSAYKEGRAVRNTRSQRAMDRGSKFGQETAEDAWKAEEANALYKLHAAGVRVPTPVMYLEGVLFMELVRGSDGQAAPRLIDTALDADQAHAAYLDMLGQLVRILSCDLIHGDLSAYNVLWAATGPTIIDFPQIVSAAQNSNSEAFFHRDARNILGHLATIEPRLRARSNADAREIWRAYVRRELTPDFMPTGQPPRAEPRPPVERENRPRDERQGSRANDRGPQQNRNPGQNRGPQQNRDPGQNRGPQQNHSRDGRNGAARPQQQGENQARNGAGPRLQMASAQANIASQSGERRPQQGEPRFQQRPRDPRPNGQRPSPQQRPEQRSPQRPQQQRSDQRSPPQRPQQQRQQQRRSPEVIVLTRRAPEPAAPAAQPARPAAEQPRVPEAARRRPR